MKRDYNLLAALLADDIENWLHIWLPDGKRTGHEYTAINPTRSDTKLGSFKVNIITGKWSDFATGDNGGNLITLYAYLFGCSNSEAYDALSDGTQLQQYTTHNYTKKTVKNVEEWELLPLPDFEPTGEHFELGYPIAKYKYENFYIFRYLKADGTKDIRPYTYRRNVKTGEQSWRWKGISEGRALYHKELICAKPILIVEGEKAANIEVDGYTVISWAGGSNAVKKTDWTPLYGREDITIWADRDEAGHKAMLQIKEILPLANIVNIDYSIGDSQDIADITQEEIYKKLQFITPPSKNDIDKKDNPAEIVINYNGKYPDIVDVDKGVIIARTGSGKTFKYEGRGDILILVPRTSQASIIAGDDVNMLINQTNLSGSIVTYNKFYGHYKRNEDFRYIVDNKKIKIIVDEAHMLFIPSQMHKLIYSLDAVFMSGTLEPFFRRDLPHYRYRPSQKEVIYYTDGELPKIKGSLVFVENAGAIEHNYPDACVTAVTRKHPNVNVHTTDKDVVYCTSALREGISIKNPNFKACMVYSKTTSLWSLKDTLQALHRVRLDGTLRVMSQEVPESYDKYIDVDWWIKKAEELMEDEKEFNAVFGEFYSPFIKSAAGVNRYEKVSEYGVLCYLAHKTRNNYDKDFYEFRKLEVKEPMNIKLKYEKDEDEDDNPPGFYRMHIDSSEWSYPISNEQRFKKWAVHYESGLIKKMMKLKDFRNFKEIYRSSSLSRSIRKNYNKSKKDKYTIDMLFKLFKKLVKIELLDDDFNVVELNNWHIDITKINIRVVDYCPLQDVIRIK